MSRTASPKSVAHDVLRLGALDLDGIDLRLADRHVQARVHGHAARPQPGVRVGQRQPPAVRLDAEQDGIVDDAAVLGRDEHVLALADGALRQVAAGQAVGERRGVRTGDLDDALDGDVPDRDRVEQVPVLLDRVGVVARQVHVVVDVVGRAAGGEGSLEERRAPVPGAEVEGARGGLRGGLDRAHPKLLGGGRPRHPSGAALRQPSRGARPGRRPPAPPRRRRRPGCPPPPATRDGR